MTKVGRKQMMGRKQTAAIGVFQFGVVWVSFMLILLDATGWVF